MKINYKKMKETLGEVLVSRGIDNDMAEKAATILTDNTCDGVASHGINRFCRMIRYIDNGYINVSVEPEVVSKFGAIEVVDGKMGMGVTNAWYCMDRAISLAGINGIGCVALRNTNHWMRAATYGIQAAKKGLVGICFTNTLPNMPAWGAKDSYIGNNPLTIAVPYGDAPVILDMAMSQFSYGKMETLALENQKLPMEGGYNNEGELTKEPKEILASGRILPTGLWKGSGLSIVLDLLATILSGGLSTKDIGEKEIETAVSQVFIAIDPKKNIDSGMIEEKIKTTLEYIKSSEASDGNSNIFYPGEQSSIRRKENMNNGILVNDKIWEQILNI